MPQTEVVPAVVTSMEGLVALLERFPDGPLVEYTFGAGESPRYSQIFRRDSMFHKLPAGVYGSVQNAPQGQPRAYLTFTESLFGTGLTIILAKRPKSAEAE